MQVFKYDHALKELPLADLQSTCTTLKEMLHPFVTSNEWIEACTTLDNLAAKDGLKLDEKLRKWQHERVYQESWLRPIWDDIYFSFRGRLPINMNYCFEIETNSMGDSPLATFITACTMVMEQIYTGQLEAESSRSGPLSMDTLTNVIATRIPSPTRDVLYHIPYTVQKKVAVACKGNWFMLSVTDNQGQILAPDKINQALNDIRTHASLLAPGTLSIFTAAKRDTAAALRDSLQQNLKNRLNLEQIENALFTVSLDDASEESFCSRLLSGNPENRWFDKSMQIITDGDKIGINFEHGVCDAGIWIHILNLIEQSVMKPSAETVSAPAVFRLLVWQISADLSAQLDKEMASFKAFAGKTFVSEQKLTNISRNRIKAAGVRPDSFVQLLYQATHHKLRKTYGSTYESVSTRAFYQGRTECTRSCTTASVELVNAYETGTDKNTFQKLFAVAQKAHATQLDLCQRGLGPERYLSGLLAICAMEDLKVPAFFHTEAYRKLKYDQMSTSSVMGSMVKYFCFGPVVKDGLGLGYGVKREALHLVVSSYAESDLLPDDFHAAMQEIAEDWFALLA